MHAVLPVALTGLEFTNISTCLYLTRAGTEGSWVLSVYSQHFRLTETQLAPLKEKSVCPYGLWYKIIKLVIEDFPHKTKRFH